MTSKEQTGRRLIAQALAYVCVTGSISTYLQPVVGAFAKDKSSKSEHKKEKSKKEKSSKKSHSGPSATGLDRETLTLINRGLWKDATTRLETLTAGKTEIGKNESWLAFAYMFLNNCEPLKALAARVGENPSSDNVQAVLIAAYNDICEQKLDVADKRLQAIPDKLADDPTVMFALAAISGKQGRASDAIEYSRKAVELAPDFGWGYRTIGFLEQRFIKDNKKADEAFAQAFAIEPDLREAVDTLIDLRVTANDLDGALDVAQRVLELHPKDAESYYRIALIYIQQARLREALVMLQDAISRDETDPRFYRSRALIKRHQGDLAAAIDDQSKAVQYGKDKAFELGELANLNLLAGNKNRAIDNLQEALKLNKKDQNVRARLWGLFLDEKRYDDLVAMYKEEIIANPKDAKLHLGLANTLVLADKQDAAVEEFIQAANLDTIDPEPHRALGALRIKQKNYDAAAKEFTRALNINPASIPDLVALGYSYALDRKYVEAETALVTSLALQQLTASVSPNVQPTRIQINRALADLLYTEGRYSDAAANFEAIYAQTKNTADGPMDNFTLSEAKAMRDLTQSTADALLTAYGALDDKRKADNKVALVSILTKVGRVDKAIEFAGTAETDNSSMNLQLARIARLKKDYARAESIASKLVALNTLTAEQKSDAQEELAKIAYAQGSYDKAFDWAEKAKDTFDKNYEAWETIGRVYLNKGDTKNAMDAAKKSNSLDPYYARAYLLLGDAQVAANQTKDASTSYRKASEVYPGLLEAHKSLLQTLVKLSMKEEAKKEEEQIAQMEKAH